MSDSRHSDPIADLLARFGPPPGDPVLLGRIHDEIARTGPISFARFMELALYDPEHGYYATRPTTIGARGDFTTAPEVHPVFGWLLAVLAAAVVIDLGGAEIEIVEHGGGTGSLAAAFVPAARLLLHDRFRYRVMDVSTRLRERQQSCLEDVWPAGRWTVEPPTALPSAGPRLILANELLDALPFHRVVRTATGWKEVLTGADGERFVDVLSEIVDPDVRRLADRLPNAPVGAHGEVSPDVERWLRQQAATLSAGALLIVDYGGSPQQLLEAGERGTLRTFHQHTVGSNPFVRVGWQDITASVDFDLVAAVLTQAGLMTFGTVSQATLLRSLLEQPEARVVLESFGERRERLAAELDELTDPNGFGAFRCLLAGRDLPRNGRVGALWPRESDEPDRD